MRGIWTALVTPFTDHNALDLTALRRILEEQVSAGVSGVVVCGTTGESPTLSLAEKKILISTVVQELKGSGVQVFVGSGSNHTEESLELSLWAADFGVDGLLVVTPYYNKPSQAGLEAHYRRIADSVSCEVALYNVPGRTGVSLTAETIARLAEHPRIRSLKEASGNISFASEILDALTLNGRSLSLLSGDDATFLPFLSVGGVGAISVFSNLFPKQMVQLQQAFDQGDLLEAQRIHHYYYPVFRDLFVESNPVPVKFAMAQRGLCKSHVRLPLFEMTASSQNKLLQTLQRVSSQLKIREPKEQKNSEASL